MIDKGVPPLEEISIMHYTKSHGISITCYTKDSVQAQHAVLAQLIRENHDLPPNDSCYLCKVLGVLEKEEK